MVEIPVIYEDKNFIAVNKPSGLLVHGVLAGGKSQMANREATLADWLRKHYPETSSVGDLPAGRQAIHMRPGLVHRLDKETSGVLIVARNQSSFEYLKSLFQKREIQKTYLALVRGTPKNKTGVINSPIGIGEGTLKRSVHAERMKKEAHTEYEVVKEYNDDDNDNDSPLLRRGHGDRHGHGACALLRVFPKTGRTHQIRVHLASIGHPIVGDRLYGGKARTVRHASSVKRHDVPPARLMLHALSLEFVTKEGQRIKIEAEPPEEFDRFMI